MIFTDILYENLSVKQLDFAVNYLLTYTNLPSSVSVLRVSGMT